MNTSVPCPVVGCIMCDPPAVIDFIIRHLNDQHEWTREQIADWLYAEEEKLGFVTVIESEALKPEMIAEQQPEKVTV